MPIVSVISVFLIILINTVFLDLWIKTVDLMNTAEFRSDRYVCSIWANERKKKRYCQTFGLVKISENPYPS